MEPLPEWQIEAAAKTLDILFMMYKAMGYTREQAYEAVMSAPNATPESIERISMMFDVKWALDNA